MTPPQPPPPDNRALITALRAAYAQRRPPRQDFSAALVGASLFVPTTPDGQFVLFGDGAGMLYAFGDLESVGTFYFQNQRLGAPPRCALVPARDLCEMSVRHGVGLAVVIPETVYQLGRGEIHAVLEGVMPVDGGVMTTEPTDIAIGRPANPPTPECLAEMRAAVADAGPADVTWFWVQIGEGPPHLGIAVHPDSDELRRRIGESIQPIWKRYRPDNPMISALPAPFPPAVAEFGAPL